MSKRFSTLLTRPEVSRRIDGMDVAGVVWVSRTPAEVPGGVGVGGIEVDG